MLKAAEPCPNPFTIITVLYQRMLYCFIFGKYSAFQSSSTTFTKFIAWTKYNELPTVPLFWVLLFGCFILVSRKLGTLIQIWSHTKLWFKIISKILPRELIFEKYQKLTIFLILCICLQHATYERPVLQVYHSNQCCCVLQPRRSLNRHLLLYKNQQLNMNAKRKLWRQYVTHWKVKSERKDLKHTVNTKARVKCVQEIFLKNTIINLWAVNFQINTKFFPFFYYV